MNFEDYELAAEETAIYPGSGTGSVAAVTYTVLGLVGEAGEIANKLKKVLRDNGGVLTEEARTEMVKEFGDVLWYLTRGLDELGSALEWVAAENVTKLRSRKQRGTLQGSGDNR